MGVFNIFCGVFHIFWACSTFIGRVQHFIGRVQHFIGRVRRVLGVLNFFFCAGFHRTARDLETCTLEGPGASNTKIPQEDPQRERKRAKMEVGEGKKKRNFGRSGGRRSSAGEGKKSAKFWAPFFWVRVPHTSGPPSGLTLLPSPTPTHTIWPNALVAKFGLAKCGCDPSAHPLSQDPSLLGSVVVGGGGGGVAATFRLEGLFFGINKFKFYPKLNF